MVLRSKKSNISSGQHPNEDPITERSFQFNGNRLILSNLLATPTINVGGEQIVITAKGKTSRLDLLRVDEATGTITSKHSKPAASISISSKGRLPWLFRWLLRNTSIQITTEDDTIELAIQVPKFTCIEITDVDGDITIGNTQGDLVLNVGYAKVARVGTVTNTEVECESSSHVTIASVTGTLSIDAGYNSRVKVLEGTISNLELDCDSSSRVNIGGRIVGARVKSDYSTIVNLSSVYRMLRVSAGSSSEVQVRGGNVDTLEVEVDYNSRITFVGEASFARINLGSSCRAVIGRVTFELQLDTGYNSEVDIGGGDQHGNLPDARIDVDSSTQTDIHAFIQKGRISTGYNSRVSADGFGSQVRIKEESTGRVAAYS